MAVKPIPAGHGTVTPRRRVDFSRSFVQESPRVQLIGPRQRSLDGSQSCPNFGTTDLNPHPRITNHRHPPSNFLQAGFQRLNIREPLSLLFLD